MVLLDSLLPWIAEYGALALFFLLALGIIILPIPDESLLIATGYLLATGDLKPLPTVFAAITGAWCGMTVSYCLGRYLGHRIIQSKFGKIIGLQGRRFEKTQNWFRRIGKWSLVVGYFIPGVRHVVGYMAGALSFQYRQFVLFAYSGGTFWSILFLTVGYLLQQHGESILQFFRNLGAALSRLFV